MSKTNSLFSCSSFLNLFLFRFRLCSGLHFDLFLFRFSIIGSRLETLERADVASSVECGCLNPHHEDGRRSICNRDGHSTLGSTLGDS